MTLDNEHELANSIVKNIKSNHPNINMHEFFTGTFAKSIMGELPEYSGRKRYQLCSVTTVTVSSFALCYSYDAEICDWVFVAIKCPKSTKLSLLGGFINLDCGSKKYPEEGEQPLEGLVREIYEETSDSNCNPILKNINYNRFNLIWSGIDYRGSDTGKQGTHNTGYALRLTTKELKDINEHSQKTILDKSYADAVQKATNGEVRQVIMIKSSNLRVLSQDCFKHPHEFDALKILNAKLSTCAAI